MSLLDALYQETILEHHRRPRNRGALHPHDVAEEGVNPSCGDEVTLYLRLEEGRVAGIGFEGEGCAISQATASLMTQAVSGRTVDEALELAQRFREMLHGAEPHQELGDLGLLKSVSRLPARVKCAALPFTTLERALQRAGTTK